MKAVNNTVDQAMQFPIHGQSGFQQAAHDMPIHDQDYANAFGIIEKNIATIAQIRILIRVQICSFGDQFMSKCNEVFFNN